MGSVFVFFAVAMDWATCCSGRLTSFFPVLDMVELDGGQRANSPGLVVHQAMRDRLHIFSESEVSPVGGLVG